MTLPKFTDEQQEIVVLKLIEMDPPRSIAQWLQNNYDDFKPHDMDQKEYERVIINRCKDYVSNKGRKWYKIIQEGREKFRKELIHWAIGELIRAALFADSYRHRDAMESLDLKDAVKLSDKVWELMDLVYTPIYGARDADYETDYLNPAWLTVGKRRARMEDREPIMSRKHKPQDDCD